MPKTLPLQSNWCKLKNKKKIATDLIFRYKVYIIPASHSIKCRNSFAWLKVQSFWIPFWAQISISTSSIAQISSHLFTYNINCIVLLSISFQRNFLKEPFFCFSCFFFFLFDICYFNYSHFCTRFGWFWFKKNFSKKNENKIKIVVCNNLLMKFSSVMVWISYFCDCNSSI